jgi:glycosyltransferase involved in cell wall biosynthesis
MEVKVSNPTVSIVTACFNERDNIKELCRQIKQTCETHNISYEHILIDNASTDGTVEILREVAAQDSNVKVIMNLKNFGHIRSGFHGLLQARGAAVIAMASDLQDPVSLIPDLVEKWRSGHFVVLAKKIASREPLPLFLMRKAYYKVINALSESPLTENATGFGIYDKRVIDQMGKLEDPYPYFRGLVAELGYAPEIIDFEQPLRAAGRSKSSLYVLLDAALLGITSHSKIPLRLASVAGLIFSVICFGIGAMYFLYKLLFWSEFPVGTAPVVIGLFMFASVQLLFIGVLGEYIGAIYTHVVKRPLVVERERLNF